MLVAGNPWEMHASGNGDIREGHGACEGHGGGEEEEHLEEEAHGEAKEGWLRCISLQVFLGCHHPASGR